MSTTGRLRELIRAVRSCKTAAEERALIQKECASIRFAFKENRESSRSANMLKLLYISMLGYPTEFGQMEVVKLIAQADYGGKRIGYLTLAVVLDETHEVLTLAENHIKKDLSNSNSFVQAIALDVVANVAGEDMARDVLHEVEQLVDSPNGYLRRKACLAALRIVKKAPDHAEIFLEKLHNLFNERNSGSLMCALTLVNQCLQTEQGQQHMQKYRQLVTSAVRTLKQLVLSSKVTDQDIGGVSDPFLQIKILQFLRITGRGSSVASEAMNDVLAQVATNTDASKNVGSAVHYECVKTINAIVADDGLRVLGINTVGRFLTSTKDNNVRFVALATLLQLVSTDVEAVQRHHSTVIDCLKDPDLSIRRRALELTVALIDTNSVRILVPDLLQYLQACSEDVRDEVAEQIASVIATKSPTPEWRVEMSLRLLRVAREHVPVAFALAFTAFVTQQTAELHRLAVSSLWEEISGSVDASVQRCQAILYAAMWLVGEYSSHLVSGGVAADTIGSAVASVTTNTMYNPIKQYGLTVLMKLATRYAIVRPIAIAVFDTYASNLDCELQQRSCEYTTMLESFAEIAAFSFSAMPPIQGSDEEIVPLSGELSTGPSDHAKPPALPQQQAPQKMAIDDLFGPSPVVPSTSQPVQPLVQKPSSLADDLFGPSPTVSATVPPAAAPSPSPASLRVDDLFGPTKTAAAPQPVASVAAPPPSYPAFRCDDCSVAIMARYAAPATLQVELQLVATGSTRLQGVAFHVAVPKTSTVEVLPLPASDVAPGGTLSQRLTVVAADAAKAKQLMLRVKLVYQAGLQTKDHLFQFSQEIA